MKIVFKVNQVVSTSSTNSQKLLTLNPIQDEGGGGAKKALPYQFFHCNFYKCENQPPKLSDFYSGLSAQIVIKLRL